MQLPFREVREIELLFLTATSDSTSAQRTLVHLAAKGWFPPILLKNYLLQPQISKKWKAVLRQGNCAPGCRRNSNNLEFCSAKFGFSAL